MAELYTITVYPPFVGTYYGRIGGGGFTTKHRTPTVKWWGWSGMGKSAMWNSTIRSIIHRSTAPVFISKQPMLEDRRKEQYSYEFQRKTYWPNDIQSLIRIAVAQASAPKPVSQTRIFKLEGAQEQRTELRLAA